MALATPSPTLYVSNLETKTKKPELRQQLYALFTPYGRVIDVVAKKHGGGRGQAFIVFTETSAATAAMRALSGEPFYGKDLAITYARTPSHSYVSLVDPSASRDAARLEAAKLVVSRAQGEYEQLEKEREAEERGEKRELDAEGDAEDGPRASKKARGDENEDEDEEEMEIEMEDDEDAVPKANGSTAAGGGSSGPRLICTNLPPDCNVDIMGALFSQYPGYSTATALPPTVRPPSSHPEPNPGAKSFAVAFASREQAQAAVGPMKGFVMQPGWEMGVSLEE